MDNTGVEASSAASNSSVSGSNPLKRDSDDVGWNYRNIIDPKDKNRLQCKLCPKLVTSGIYRLKQHIAGVGNNVKACPNASKEAIRICKQDLYKTQVKKKQKYNELVQRRKEVSIESSFYADLDLETQSERGTLDGFLESLETNPKDNSRPSDSSHPSKITKQASLKTLLDKKRVRETHQYVARWLIEAGIPFNATQIKSFSLMTEAIGQFGRGLPTPSRYLLSGPCLTDEVQRIKTALIKHQEEWSITSCSIMIDAWTDRKRISIMNLCVHCREGMSFLSSREDSDSAHTGDYIFEYVDKCIEDIGEDKVVQVVTDNALNNMAAKRLLKVKRPNVFWTSCAAHTMNLMLEGIGKQSKFKKTIDSAKELTIFIYGHHQTLSMMRTYTDNIEIVRPDVTRFASTYLTLDSLLSKKEQLRTMFGSNAFDSLKHSKSVAGKKSYDTVFSQSFWNKVTHILEVFKPLVEVLHIVDGDRPSIPWLYGKLKEVKEDIKSALNGVEGNYKPLLDIIELKGKGRLDNELHVTAYFLNPFYFAKNRAGIGGHGSHTKFSFDPVGWWSNYGGSAKNLQRMAIRILSLTTSSLGCERNWSSFAIVHTKNRNRLTTEKLNDLVYVQFNSKLFYKKKRNDILEASDYNKAQHMMVDGVQDVESDVDEEIDPITGATHMEVGDVVQLREPCEEEEFVSEPEDIDENNDAECRWDED
ncbi:uncharacterized protein LOC124924617 [Impatiens glandulifera]|uniref:uncharacterized protein LOC124924617 n=1 Tax=Impatiens glandulifera TaxID=253017 RepID=UPI001FB14A04|nr:uncharacterized protein LOC124924617 [Impatiens glandulifera]